ncbi:hypothetical protein [Methylobacterium haplocladii]|uniref:Secreted protein n=1 Tax=Methylobacterium haplocladii TaxID=1176176 RepID=A0A512ITX9_9HYPH|nr:hypothetical protein [Methylobacterium haplocladii]GEP01162.1 hypothetical protein MHA02_35490 [Methylobacterium haplocladii]GJD82878.1 hypothetical protein HPGCJGGD_0740 [Methylobacterium haplocladii]GLS59013.1 hypothetical protein GCM10007887_16790 [Methylobacterium haplocladii]
MRAGSRLPFAVAILCVVASAAEARPARCFTSDDGAYPCDFQATDRDGSFAIAAPGKPTYRLNMGEPGYAFGFVDLGGRNVALPGRYRPLGGPRGCWANDDTGTKICAE